MRTFDTETPNRFEGGYAVLLLRSDGTHSTHYPFPKTFREIFAFLALKDSPHYMTWNLDFDARAILHEKFIPYKKLERLALDGHTTYRGFRIKYIPRKFLRVSKGRKHFELYDLAQFYGFCSLRSAAEKYLAASDQKDTIPERWYRVIDEKLKDSRTRDRVIQYGLRDVEVTWKLFKVLEDSFAGMKIAPRKWVSSASVSMQVFRRDLQKEPRPPLYVQELFRGAFYGGRVEVGVLGKVGKCNLYDLHSAYPAEAAKLVSLREGYYATSAPGEWVYNPLVRYGAYRVTASVPESWHWGPLAVREKKTELFYPVGEVKTWCCLPAIQTMRRLKIPFQVHEAHEYLGYGDDEPLFHGIESLYLERKDPKKSIAVKLVLNSLYGKLCETREKYFDAPVSGRWHGFQRIETREVFGRYANFIFASHLTEAVRMKIFETLHKFGRKAYMTATDSVLVDGTLPETPGLGGWGLKMKCESGVIFGCGRYYLKEAGTDETVFQFRGYTPNPENLEILRNAQRRTATIKVFRGVSLHQWVRDGGVGDFNVLKNVSLSFQIEDTKRYFPMKFDKISESFLVRQKSFPWIKEVRHAGRSADRSTSQTARP